MGNRSAREGAGRGARRSILFMSRCSFGFGYCAVEMKEVVYPGDFQSLVDALIHAHQPEAAAISLSRDVGSDQCSNP